MKSKRGSKGQEIEYKSLEMSEYLSPINSILNIKEKRNMFAIRNRMFGIPSNFGNKDEKCVCGSLETMPHIYDCETLNDRKSKPKYDEIYNGSLNYKIEIFRRPEISLEKRQEIITKNSTPCDLSDPLDYS